MTGITQRPGGFSYQRMTNVSPATWQVFSPAGRVAALTYSARDAERVADALGYQHPPAAEGVQAGEVRAWETEDGRVISARQKETALRDGGASASSVAIYSIPLYTAPPSAPVGVEDIIEAFDEISGLCRHLRQGGPVPEDLQDLSDALDEAVGIASNMLHALAQQPAAVDGAMVERIAALLHEEATAEPWTVAGVEHPGPDRDYYRGLARKVAALAAQQPVAVDVAAAKRAVAAVMSAPDGISVEAFFRIVLEAAVAAQQQEKSCN